MLRVANRCPVEKSARKIRCLTSIENRRYIMSFLRYFRNLTRQPQALLESHISKIVANCHGHA